MGCGASSDQTVNQTGVQSVHPQQSHHQHETNNQQYNQHETNHLQYNQHESNHQQYNQHETNHQQYNQPWRPPDQQQQPQSHGWQPPTQGQQARDDQLANQHSAHNQSSAVPAAMDGEEKSDASVELEESVAVARSLLDSETDYQMKSRLAAYNIRFNASYKIREMIEFNRTRGGIGLFPYHRKVVFAWALQELVRPEIKKLEFDYMQENPWDEDYFIPENFIGSLAISNLQKYGMKFPLIKRYVEKCIVADLVGTEEEYWADLRQDVLMMIGEIESPQEPPMFAVVYLNELKEQYEIFLRKYDSMNGVLYKQPPTGDPNQLIFPLDNPFLMNPELLRAWVETWEKFDTEVPETEWDPWYFKEKFEDIPKPEDVLIRSDDLPPLNHEIDGEAAWNVIEIDLFKNDVTTPQQDEIWKLREARTDLDDPKRMEKRRKAIEQYFLAKYEWPPSKLEPYSGFLW